MSKILYPVGTEVQIRDWKIKELPMWSLPARKYIVKKYHKGEDKPYVVERGFGNMSTASERFSVDEIKRYRGPSDEPTKTKTVEQVFQATEPLYSTTQIDEMLANTYTKEEVDQLLHEQESRFSGWLDNHQENVAKRVDAKIEDMHDHLLVDANAIAHEVLEHHTLSDDE